MKGKQGSEPNHNTQITHLNVLREREKEREQCFSPAPSCASALLMGVLVGMRDRMCCWCMAGRQARQKASLAGNSSSSPATSRPSLRGNKAYRHNR